MTDPTSEGGLAIVVTVPRSQLTAIGAHKPSLMKPASVPGVSFYYWSLPTLPAAKRRNGPQYIERVYFLWDGAVRGFHEVVGWVGADGEIDGPWHVGPEIPGPAVLIAPDFHSVDPPLPMTGFRGFRYFEVPDA